MAPTQLKVRFVTFWPAKRFRISGSKLGITMESSIMPRAMADRTTDTSAALYAPPLADLYRSVQILREEVVSAGKATMTLWRQGAPKQRLFPGAAKPSPSLGFRH